MGSLQFALRWRGSTGPAGDRVSERGVGLARMARSPRDADEPAGGVPIR